MHGLGGSEAWPGRGSTLYRLSCSTFFRATVRQPSWSVSLVRNTTPKEPLPTTERSPYWMSRSTARSGTSPEVARTVVTWASSVSWAGPARCRASVNVCARA